MLIFKKPLWSFFVVWLLASAIGLYVRLYPLITYASFESQERATLYVIDQIRNRVINDIHKNASRLSEDEKNVLIKKNLDHIIKHESKRVQDTIAQVARAFDQKLKDTVSYPYLLASDSYYYFSLTQNIVETGKLGPQVKGSKYFNPQMLAPLGFWEPLNFYPYLGYFVYRTIQWLNPSATLMYAVSFTPLFIMLFISFIFLLICRSLKCSSLVSFISCALFLLTPVFLKRSIFAWYDDDPPMIFFSLLILWLLLRWADPKRKLKNKLIYAAVVGITFTLFSLFWHGWMFLLSIVALSQLAFLIINHFYFSNPHETKNLCLSIFIIFTAAFIGIGTVFGFTEFFVLIQEGATALNDFINKKIAFWPDLYLGVGELKKTPVNIVIELTGGKYYFITALVGLTSTGILAFKNKDKQKAYSFALLFILLMLSFAMGLKALRFTLLTVLPIAVLFPIGLQFLFDGASGFLASRAPSAIFKSPFSKASLWLLAFLLLIPYVRFVYRNTPELLNKIFNSTWEKTLVKIYKDTPQDSIVNTWWPPGHFIKAIARRRVTFDGATINKPQGYWMAQILLSTDEKEALGLLRMLNNSANQAAEYLEGLGLPLSTSVAALKKIAPLNLEAAQRYIKDNLMLSDSQSQQLLSLTHQKPPPSYLLIFNETIEKNIELKFIGGWDFKKVEELNSSPEALKKVPARRSPEYIEFLWKIAGGPYRFSGTLGSIAQSGNIIHFEQNVQVNLDTKDCAIASKQYGKGVPFSIFYLNNTRIVEKRFPQSNLRYSVILFEEDGNYKCVLLDRVLAQSLIMQLYFLQGADLQYLTLFAQENDLTHRTKIFVYEVQWDKFLSDLQNPTSR